MIYRPEIDGLRALAVLPVVLFHAGFEWFSGGFVGVDVFFVISGYLITTIIISEMATGKFSLLNFYERRARRILPALFFVMVACLPFAWLWLTPSDLIGFGQSLVAVSTFSSNILFWWESGYFDAAAEFKPLLHTWSLAVEEQYYIIFPLFLMLTWRLGVRRIFTLLSIVFIASLGVAHLATNYAVAPKIISGAFFLLPTRGWELLVGVFVAFYLQHNTYFKSHTLNQILSLLGLGMIMYSIVVFDESTPFPSLHALIPTIGAGLLILCAVPNTLTHRFLSLSPVVGIGLISYSTYLWHQPLFAFARHRLFGEVSNPLLLLLCIASFGMAYFSWRWVEQPFRDKQKTTRKFIFSFSLIGILGLSLTGLTVHINGGYIQRFTKEEIRILGFTSPSKENSCFLDAGQSYDAFTADCQNGNILLWGDSHAAALAVGMRALLNASQLTAAGCPPLYSVHISDRPNCLGVNSFVLEYIRSNSIDKVLLHSNWLDHEEEDLSKINETITKLIANNKEIEIVVIGGVPQWKQNLPVLLFRSRKTLSSNAENIYLFNSKIEEVIERDKFLISLIEKHNSPNVRFFSLVSELCLGSECLAAINVGLLEPFAWDYGHLTASGSAHTSHLILNELNWKLK